MDKLELDARVAHLERKVAILTVLVLGFLGVFGVSILLFTARSEIRATPATMVSMPTVVTEAPRPPLDFSEGSVGSLTNQLRSLANLRDKSVLTNSEFQAKKTQLLGRPIRSTNLGPELEQIAELQEQNVLTNQEYQQLKTKVLELEK